MHALRRATAEDKSLREYPYVDGKGLGKVVVKPILPGIFLDISFRRFSQGEARVIVADPMQSPEHMRENALVLPDIFLGIDEGVDPRSSLILSSSASQKLYEIQKTRKP